MKINGLIEKISDHHELIGKLGRFCRGLNLLGFQLLDWLGVMPSAHSKVFEDMRRACDMISIFFPTDFWDSEVGLPFKDSLIVNQIERAKSLPNVRYCSIQYRPHKFFKNLDALDLETKTKDKPTIEVFPEEWDHAIRPIIARREWLLPKSSS